MIDATNAARATGYSCGSAGDFPPAPPLTANPVLSASAQSHADDMAARDYFSHTGSDGSSFSERITRAGYTWSAAAENLVAGYPQASRAVAALLDSPGHCRNIMDPSLQHIGIGHSTNSDSTYGDYWVQNFASPR